MPEWVELEAETVVVAEGSPDMDSAVIAAIITTPTALFAAGAAYTAGRAQARGAHRGPVDVIRRQHQRDAYASLRAAAHTFAMAVAPGAQPFESRTVGQDRAGTVRLLTRDDADAERNQWSDEQRQRAADARASVDTEVVLNAVAVVQLEGPDHIAALAAEIEEHARYLQLALYAVASRLHGGSVDIRLPDGSQATPQGEHQSLVLATQRFTTGARAWLNGH